MVAGPRGYGHRSEGHGGPAGDAPLHRFHQTDILFHGTGSILHRKAADDVGVDTVHGIPAAPHGHAFRSRGPPVIGVEHIARIDLKRKRRPQEPRPVFGGMGVCEAGESEFELASIREGHHAEKQS